MTQTLGLDGAAREPPGRADLEAVPLHPRSWLDQGPVPPTTAVALIEVVLEALGLTAFICDGGGRVRGLTAAAARALHGGHLTLVRGRLAATSPACADELEGAISQAVSAARHAARTQVVVHGGRGAALEAQILDVLTLPCPAGLALAQPLALVVLRTGPRGRAELEPILSRLFGLTPAEADVAARLAAGEPREAIAAARGVSLQTVRSQIKAIFSKLGVTRERQLAALLRR